MFLSNTSITTKEREYSLAMNPEIKCHLKIRLSVLAYIKFYNNIKLFLPYPLLIMGVKVT